MTPCTYCEAPAQTLRENILGTYWRCTDQECGAEGWFTRNPDLIPVVSYSEIASARRCPLQHQLGYYERWRKPNTDSLTPSSIGTAWHKVLEVHYLSLMDTQDAGLDRQQRLLVALAEVGQLIRTTYTDQLRALMEWMYGGYVEQHGADEEWRILGVELAGQVLLRPDEAQELDDPHGFWLKYKADLLIEYKGNLWIVDHKSYRNAPTNLDLDFDSQFDLYAWAFQQQGTPVFGQIYNGARRFKTKAPQEPADRHVRHMTYRSPQELGNVARDAYLTMRARYAEQGKFDSLGITEATRHVDSRGCNHLCDFKEACLLGRKGIPLRDNLQGRGYVQNFERH